MLTAILVILIGSYLLERTLDLLNRKKWKSTLPSELKDIYDEEQYAKAQEYDKAGQRLSFLSSTLSLIVTILVLLVGGFARLDQWTHHLNNDPIIQTLCFFGVLALVSDIVSTPFSLYKIFVIEQKFGFNRMSFATWIGDKLKGYLLGALLGGSLLAMFVLFYQLAGANFWWIAWVMISAVTLLISMFYASVILPLFNKLQPLPDGDLRSGLEAYCKKVGFRLNNLFVMDGSKRSSKANAFFSGLGPKKKIVLFDTLIQNHTTDELIAVMAHEVGHYKKKHTRTTIILSVFQTGLMLFVFSKVINNPELAMALGASGTSLPLGMLSFAFLYSPVSLFTGIFMNMLSRKHEYEADRFAAETSSGSDLGSALKKLSKDNLSNLTPHPAVVWMYYSHPTLLQRLKALKLS